MADNSDSECDLDLLNNLLANADDEDDNLEGFNPPTNTSTKKTDFDFLSCETNTEELQKTTPKRRKDPDDLKIAETHSSDEEDKDYFIKRELSDFGREVKQLLKNDSQPTTSGRFSFDKSSPKTPLSKPSLSTNIMKRTATSTPSKPAPSTPNPVSKNVYSDPIFGLGINKPLISSAELVQLMENRKPVPISTLKQFLTGGKPTEDWVVAGVLTFKSTCKKTAKGDKYAIWKISDLKMDMNTVTVFMFRSAYSSLWKVNEGTVLGILNPNIMERRDNEDLATLSVDNPARVMIMGTSRDMAICKSKKKNGDQCSNVVNVRICEYCVYHVKQEYSKHSRRSDLQSSFNGKGVTMNGQKKPQQQSSLNKYQNAETTFRVVPAKKSSAMISKDKDRLEQLRKNAVVDVKPNIPKEEVKVVARTVELSKNQGKKDLDRLNKLKNAVAASREVKLEEQQPEKAAPSEIQPRMPPAPKPVSRINFENLKSSPGSAKSVMTPKPSSLMKPRGSPLMAPKSPNFNVSLSSVPKLGVGFEEGSIDLSLPIPKRKAEMAKKNALDWIKQNGGIKPSNPNKILASKEAQAVHGGKRKRDDENEVGQRREVGEDKVSKKKKDEKEAFKEQFKKLMEVKSAHTNLVEIAEDKEKDKYFNKMEAKEKMEERMMATFQVACKAVSCLICKYTSFSASDRCKELRHPLRVTDGMKRFYKCGDCGNRTITLDRIPSTSCSKCGGSSWVKSAMMDEKKCEIKPAQLTIRGDEEKYYGSANNANLNLLVPE